MTICGQCGEANLQRARFCLACGEALAPRVRGDRDVRKTVTVVFSDLVDSTPLGGLLDPESLRLVLRRYFEVLRELFERHGATVRKFGGDAVMAVFGVPTLHEDDALRAVIAASKLGPALAELNQEVARNWNVRLAVRTAVNTGEVVVDDTAGSYADVLGDAVNVAARLEQAAGVGEVLIGAATHRLVQDATTVEPVPSLSLKGKGELVSAWRLVGVEEERGRHPRRIEAPMVGRDQELVLLDWAFERTIAERRCHLVTLVGDAGVGKTRLVDEFQRRHASQARILRSHCRSYGATAAFQPLARAVQGLAGIQHDDPPDAGRAKLASLLGDGALTARVVQVLGLGAGAAEPEDSYWALQRMLELLAPGCPLILVVDDLHWAEPPLLELLQHVGRWSRGAPILLLCLARPDLFDDLDDWTGSTLNTISLLLSPLPTARTEELIDHLLRPATVDPALRSHLAEATGGYPLFVEELVGLLVDDGTLRLEDGQWKAGDELEEIRLPPTIHALLAARLDGLPEPERRVLGRAAVVGTWFPAAAVSELLQEEVDELRATLRTLVRKELLRAEPDPGRRDRFDFRHALIRDAAYQSVPKETRAELHGQYAGWLDEHAGNRVHDVDQVDEVVGSHLEAAYRLRMQLGRLDDDARQLGRRAGERLAAAGRRAALRGDVPAAAATLLGRALALLPDNHPRRLGALLHQADALREDHRPQHALAVYDEALDLALRRGDAVRAAHATLGRLDALQFSDLSGWGAAWRRAIEGAIRVLDEAADTLGLARGLHLLATLHWATGRAVVAEKVVEQAIGVAHRAGDQRLEARMLQLKCLILYWGPKPLEEVERSTKEALEWARRTGVRTLELCTLSVLARVAAMKGRFPDARQLNRAVATIKAHPSEPLTWEVRWVSEGLVELLADNLEGAEQALRRGVEVAEEAGATIPLTNLTTMLARVLLLRQRNEEAEETVAKCERLMMGSNLGIAIRSRSIRAVLLARRGEHTSAVQLARDAARQAERSQQPDSQAEVLMDLAETLSAAGRQAEARSAVEQVLRRLAHKGNLAAASRARRFLGELPE